MAVSSAKATPTGGPSAVPSARRNRPSEATTSAASASLAAICVGTRVPHASSLTPNAARAARNGAVAPARAMAPTKVRGTTPGKT